MKVVIWGLRSTRHSHRYIHQGFFEAFQRLGYDVIWVDDKESNQSHLQGQALVIAANVASKYIIWRKENKYVVHNFERKEFTAQPNVLNLQAFTKASVGTTIDDSIAKFDIKSKTLFQPWGISEDFSNWKVPAKKRSNVELWIGAIWNNALNQGNAHIMHEYSKALKFHEIKFRRIGGTRSIRKSGIDPIKALELVNRSPIGSAMVGDWQRESQYVPCRLFKNIAAGQVPKSNADFTFLLRDIGYFSQDIKSVVDFVLNLKEIEKIEIVNHAQNAIHPYSYARGIQRILGALAE